MIHARTSIELEDILFAQDATYHSSQVKIIFMNLIFKLF